MTDRKPEGTSAEHFIHGIICDAIPPGANDGANEIVTVHEKTYWGDGDDIIFTLHSGKRVAIRIREVDLPDSELLPEFHKVPA